LYNSGGKTIWSAHQIPGEGLVMEPTTKRKKRFGHLKEAQENQNLLIRRITCKLYMRRSEEVKKRKMERGRYLRYIQGAAQSTIDKLGMRATKTNSSSFPGVTAGQCAAQNHREEAGA